MSFMTARPLTNLIPVLLLSNLLLCITAAGLSIPTAPPCAKAFALQDKQTPATLYTAAVQALNKKDYAAAEILLRQVLQLDSRYQEPSGRSAWHQLGLALEQQEKKTEAIRIMEQGQDSLQSAPQRDWYLAYDLARLYAENRIEGKEAEITRLVYEVFKNSTPDRHPDLWQRLFHEIAFLLDEPEQAKFEQALTQPGSRPGLLLLYFFRREDPFPSTPANEALPVFFQRTALARERFAQALSPRGYDARGDIYVRLGKPWRVHTDHSGIMGDVGWALQPYEVWFYNNIHPDLYFTFIRKDGRIYYTLAEGPESIFGSFYKGRRTFFNRQNVGETAMSLRDQVYRYLAPSHETFRRRLYDISNTRSNAEALDYSLLHFTNEDRKHAAQLDTIAPAVAFSDDYKQKSFPVELSFARFLDADDRMRTEIYYGTLYRDLKFERLKNEYRTQLRGEVDILNDIYETVASDSIQEICSAANATAKDSGDFISQSNFRLPPGRYQLFFRLENPQGRQVGVLRAELEVIAFAQASLSLSDIQLSPDIHEAQEAHRFVKHGYFVKPLPGLAAHKDKPLFVYFEIYNLSRDASGDARYRIDYRVSVPKQKKSFFNKIAGIFGGAGTKKHTVTLSASRTGQSPSPVEYMEFDLGQFDSGNLELEIIVTDLIAKQQVSSTLPFKLLE
jgi:GWxTD domain-containing protein